MKKIILYFTVLICFLISPYTQAYGVDVEYEIKPKIQKEAKPLNLNITDITQHQMEKEATETKEAILLLKKMFKEDPVAATVIVIVFAFFVCRDRKVRSFWRNLCYFFRGKRF